MRRDLICSVMLLGIAVLYYVLARDLGETALSDAVGPGGLPMVYAAVLAMLALLLGLSALVSRAREAPSASSVSFGEPSPVRRLARALGAMAIGVGYLLLVPVIGYPFAIALTIASMAAYQGERLGWRLALVACAGAGALFVLFDWVLGVSMPAPWKA
jgi:cell division protein FtsW (lipid II flippase)